MNYEEGISFDSAYAFTYTLFIINEEQLLFILLNKTNTFVYKNIFIYLLSILIEF